MALPILLLFFLAYAWYAQRIHEQTLRNIRSDRPIAGLSPAAIIALVLVGIIVTAGSMGLLYYILTPKPTHTVVTVTVYDAVTTTETYHAPQPVEREVSILESRGTCGTLEKPHFTCARISNYVLLFYREQADAPCYRHVMSQVIHRRIWPPLIDITLKLEKTSEVCVKCTGVIETILRVGPLRGPGNVTTVPDGTKITVNGLEIVVSEKPEALTAGKRIHQLEPAIEVIEKSKEALVFRPTLVNRGEEPVIIRHGYRLFDVRVYRDGVIVYDSIMEVRLMVLVTATIEPGEAYSGTPVVELRGWLNGPGQYRILAWADFAPVGPLKDRAEPEYVGLRVETWMEISD